MTTSTSPANQQEFEDWLKGQGFAENPFAPDGWSDDALHALLRLRLTECSHGHITQWQDLCQPQIRDDCLPLIIAAANGSPTKLLVLCDALLRYVAKNKGSAISSWDLAAILTENQPPLDVTPTSTKIGAPQRGLFIDSETGHVWIDGQQLLPPLTEQEHALLCLLYTHAPEIVSCEALIRKIWPEDQRFVGDEQNLRKLISRLRRRLEPDRTENDWRFIRSSRGRGYWLDPGVESQ